jgi:hypothetical protein
VTAGVHSAFVYQQEQARHARLPDEQRHNAMHMVDISDPYNPREVGAGAAPSPDAAAARCTTSTCRTAWRT